MEEFETEFKVGQRVRGRQAGVNVTGVNGRKVSDDVNIFEGIVYEVEAAEVSDTGDEIVSVRFTKPALFDAEHGITEGHFTPDELTLIE